MRFILVIFLVCVCHVAHSFEISDLEVGTFEKPFKHPCPQREYFEQECEVRVSVLYLASDARSRIAQARTLCEKVDIPLPRFFSSRQSDGEGVVFYCIFDRKAFADWWDKKLREHQDQ